MATNEECGEIAKNETVNMATQDECGEIAKGETVNMATKKECWEIAKNGTVNIATQEEYGYETPDASNLWFDNVYETGSCMRRCLKKNLVFQR